METGMQIAPSAVVGLGRLIRDYRIKHGLSQSEMADRLGMTRAYLSQIESRNRDWPQKYISAISRELRVSQIDLAIAAGKIELEPQRDLAVMAS